MIRLKNVTKVYGEDKSAKFEALRKVNLDIKRGEYVAIVGPSGSGKSTLLNIIGCLDRPTSGEYYLGDTEVSKFSDNQLAKLRNEELGFIFQSFNLIPRLSVLENVELPMLYAGKSLKKRRARAIEILQKVGLRDKLNNRPNELSGGQLQRVAIARALANEPRIILADEPTGNLDTASSKIIMNMLQEVNARQRVTLILVTHELEIANHADRIIHVRDGRIAKE